MKDINCIAVFIGFCFGVIVTLCIANHNNECFNKYHTWNETCNNPDHWDYEQKS